MHAPDAELHELVRSLVVAALQRLQAGAAEVPTGQAAPVDPAHGAAARRLLILFMSHEEVPEEFLAQVTALCSQGYECTAAFSHSFEQSHSVDEIAARLPAGTPRLAGSSGEHALLKAAANCVAVLSPALSSGTAAKVALGIEDSLPSLLLRNALLSGRPVIIARDLPLLERELSERYPAAAPSLLRSSADACHRLQAAGVRFVPPAHLASELAGIFHQPVNDTPERLARTRPSPRRVFITAEDVYTAASSGQKELAHPPDAVITDAAREEAVTRGVTLVARPG